jgi:hypothetical protein
MNEGSSDPGENRRRAYRADVTGVAIVHGPGGVAVRCEIVDLALGGIRLAELPCGGHGVFEPGWEVTVELECAGAGWVVQRGEVTRHRDGELAIRFHTLSADVEDLIEDEVLGAVEAARAPRVVVVDRADHRRHRFAATVRNAGCCSLEAATPLEAIELVERSRNHVRAVAVAETLTQTQADELVTYLADAHPELHVALIGDGDDDRADASVRTLAKKLCGC